MAAITPLNSAKRIVIKIGSALLVDTEAHSLRHDWLQGLAKDIKNLRDQSIEVLIVSSGSIALGRQVLGLPAGPLDLAQSQAAAAVGQIALARAYEEVLGAHDIQAAQILLTSEDGENRRRYLNTRATLRALLDMGTVPIVNENDTVATDEIRFGDNDRLAAQLAVMAEADLLILLSDVDGLYSGNPHMDDDVVHLPEIDAITPEILAMAGVSHSENSKGGMITKLDAGKTAMAGGVAMAIAQGNIQGPISAIEAGAKVSWFTPKTNAKQARKSWIMAMKPRGRVMVDDGAMKALMGGASLLAAGCIGADGQFSRGDVVDIVSNGQVVARGLVGYDQSEAEQICGAQSEGIEKRLGYAGRGAMIHRDNLTMI